MHPPRLYHGGQYEVCLLLHIKNRPDVSLFNDAPTARYEKNPLTYLNPGIRMKVAPSMWLGLFKFISQLRVVHFHAKFDFTSV
jgi:hypothetical protein